MLPEPSLPRPMHPVTADRPNSVYRYYDHAGRLIYVGITARGITRQHEHNATSDFWPHVATQQVEHCPDRETALRVERALIEAHRPPFNRQHNGDWERLRAAYLGIVEAERVYAALRAGTPLFPGGCRHCPTCRAIERGQPAEAPCDLIADGFGCTDCGNPACQYMYGNLAGFIQGLKHAGGSEAGYQMAYNAAHGHIAYDERDE